MYLTLRTGCERHGRKNPLPFPISKRSPVSGLRQIRKQGKGRSSKRKGNRRCPFLFAHRRGYGVVPAAGRGTFPPSADGESPLLRFSEKLSARKGRTRLRQFECPAGSVQRKEPPRQGEHANAVRVPRWVGAEKEPPRQGEHADAVRVPRSAGAENPGNPEKIFPPEKAAKTPILTPRKRLSERHS